MIKMLAASLFFLFSNGGPTTNMSTTSVLPTTTIENSPPISIDTIPTESVYTEDCFEYLFVVNKYFKDPDGDPLRVRVEADTYHGKDFNDWLQFDSTLNKFEGTPSCKNVGTYHMDIFAEDNKGGSVSLPFSIKVISKGCGNHGDNLNSILASVIGFTAGGCIASLCTYFLWLRCRRRHVQHIMGPGGSIAYTIDHTTGKTLCY